MRQIKALHPNIVASADDIVIFHNDLETDATELARHYGLTINADKCRSAQRGQEVTFLGAPVSRERLSIPPKAIANADEHLKLVMEAPISHHAKLTLARINVIPMASYAPLVEMDSPHEPYNSFDMRVGTALAGMLDSSPARTQGQRRPRCSPSRRLPQAAGRREGAAHEEMERKARHCSGSKGSLLAPWKPDGARILGFGGVSDNTKNPACRRPAKPRVAGAAGGWGLECGGVYTCARGSRPNPNITFRLKYGLREEKDIAVCRCKRCFTYARDVN